VINLYNFIVFQELNVADRLGKFTMVQWAFLASGIMLAMFVLIMGFLPIIPSIILGFIIIGFSAFLAFFERYGMPFYEFFFVFLAFKSTPKEMVYGSNSMDEDEDENFDEEESFEII
jgi:hypothetical protein